MSENWKVYSKRTLEVVSARHHIAVWELLIRLMENGDLVRECDEEEIVEHE